MIAVPNVDKPKVCEECLFYEYDSIFEDERWSSAPKCLLDGDSDDCSLIEIAEPTETLIYDIRKLITFIELRMIIASTYTEQIERAEAVKDWLLSIVGEFNADRRTQHIESVE